VAHPFLSVPEVLAGVRDEVWEVSELAQRYADSGERFRRSFIREQDYPYRAAQPHHLLGDASSIQDDVRLTPTLAVDEGDWARQWRLAPDRVLGHREAWRTLLGLYWDDRIGLQIGDGGALHVLAPVDDLVIGRLDRLICDVSSG
jgi:hypothetical protein